MKVVAYLIIIIFIAFILNINENKLHKNNWNKYIKIFIISLMVSIYSAILDFEGLPDRVNYITRFNMYSNSNMSFYDIIEKFDEFGYVLLNILISKITTSQFLFFFIITFLVTFINLNIFVKLNEKYKLAILFYFVSLLFFNTTYLLRQSIAIAIGNISLLYLLRGKKIRYFIFMLVSISFHSSAIFILFIGLIYALRKYKYIPHIIIIFYIILFLGFSTIMPKILSLFEITEKYINYETDFIDGSFLAFTKGIPFYIISLISIIYFNKITKTNSNYKFYCISSFVYSLSIIFSINFYWFPRLALYLMVPTLSLIPIISDSFLYKKHRDVFVYITFLMQLLITLRQMLITFY